MNLKRRKLLVEPPSTAAPDIAFILIIFFLVCASVQPDTGKLQDIPKSESNNESSEQNQNLEVSLTEQTVMVNGDLVPLASLTNKVAQSLAGKTKESDRVVIVKSSKETNYQRWITATTAIEAGGGIITIQVEQEQVQIVQ